MVLFGSRNLENITRAQHATLGKSRGSHRCARVSDEIARSTEHNGLHIIFPILGGASGIGLGIVESLIGQGAKVAILDRQLQQGSDVANRLGKKYAESWRLHISRRGADTSGCLHNRKLAFRTNGTFWAYEKQVITLRSKAGRVKLGINTTGIC